MTTTSQDAGATLAIRQATTADLLAVFRIEKTSFNEPWPYAAFEHYLEEPAFLVADEDGKVVGYVLATVVPNHGRPLGHIKDFAVHPDRRGEGVGTELLSQALATVTARGAQSVKLEVRADNDAAIGLYQSFGFEHFRTVPRYYGDGTDAYVMFCTFASE